MKYLPLALLLTAGAAAAALAQSPAVPAAVTKRTPPPAQTAAIQPAAAPAPEALPPSGGTALMLRGLDKVTGRPTDILAPIGHEVRYATLSITARFCYSTPASETPETTAFVQIDDRRPDQAPRKVFSGWMYASSPGLNPMDHPTYDVWVIGCNNAAASSPAAVAASTAPVKVAAPDSSDKEKVEAMPEGAGR